MVVNGVQQPYYGVACRDPHQGSILVRAFDREHEHHDRDRDDRIGMTTTTIETTIVTDANILEEGQASGTACR
jgi:hypothetical protein